MGTTVQYLHHSSMLVYREGAAFLFDYDGSTPLPVEALSKADRLYVFASHHHGDHFSPAIWPLAEEFAKVCYILSDDIAKADVPADKMDLVHWVAPYETHEFEGFQVSTLRSNDAGVAFDITFPDYRIYYAGDLNWWHWEGEPDSWNADMETLYKAEIARIAGGHFDIAFVPMDPRLGEAYFLGALHFLEQTYTKVLFPMHMWGDYSPACKVIADSKALKWKDRLVFLKKPLARITL